MVQGFLFYLFMSKSISFLLNRNVKITLANQKEYLLISQKKKQILLKKKLFIKRQQTVERTPGNQN
jgi:hypothetical protein